MKPQNERPDLSEMPPYRLGRHWNTIQAYLIPGLEDDIGELSEELKNSVVIFSFASRHAASGARTGKAAILAAAQE